MQDRVGHRGSIQVHRWTAPTIWNLLPRESGLSRPDSVAPGSAQGLARDRRGGYGRGKTCVEGEMRDSGSEFGLGETILYAAPEMGWQFIRPAEPNRGRDGHEAAVALRKVHGAQTLS
jgi:hypothetical protein